MAGFIPAIHVFLLERNSEDVDGRDKPGHDERIQKTPPRFSLDGVSASLGQQMPAQKFYARLAPASAATLSLSG